MEKPLASTEMLPLLPMQARSLANSAKGPKTRFFSWAAISDLDVDPVRLKACLDRLMDQTDSLRAAFVWDADRLAQRVMPQQAGSDYVPLIHHDVKGRTEAMEDIVARHADVINSLTGTNIALIAVMDGAALQDILLLANHFFLDFYSVSWVTAAAFRIYRDEAARALPPASYGDLCRWMERRARDRQTLQGVLDAIKPQSDSLAMPSFIARSMIPIAGPNARPLVNVKLDADAVRQFRSLTQRLRTNDYWLGLALLAHIEGTGGTSPKTLHISIKESGRGILPLNTVGLPSFLAATSEIAVPTMPGLAFEDYFARLAPLMSASNRLGVSVSNFALPGLPADLMAAAAARIRPALLYNCVNINAFSAKPQSEGSFGIHRDQSYSKREDLEVRFIHAQDAIQISVSTTKPFDISGTAQVIGARITQTLAQFSAVHA